VRETKKKKPYIVCDPCGLQMFVRNRTGMGRFEQLVTNAEQRDIWARLEELQQRYQKKCPDCGHRFWIKPEQIKTSWVDGHVVGYRCPESGCAGVVPWEQEKK
jgi:DNA-directed RNA polymerase subunit RPC12/RpoP